MRTLFPKKKIRAAKICPVDRQAVLRWAMQQRLGWEPLPGNAVGSKPLMRRHLVRQLKTLHAEAQIRTASMRYGIAPASKDVILGDVPPKRLNPRTQDTTKAASQTALPMRARPFQAQPCTEQSWLRAAFLGSRRTRTDPLERTLDGHTRLPMSALTLPTSRLSLKHECRAASSP